MTDAPTLAARIEAAYFARQSQIRRRLTLGDFGAEIAREEGRDTPYKPSTVKDWMAGRGEPRVATLAAIARLAGMDFATLALGPDTRGAPAASPPATATRPKRRPIPKPDPASVEGPPVTPTVPRRASGDGR